MNIEVISVSKHPEKLNVSASAIQVITQKDIRSSGAKTLAEALRLAANLQVAQANSSQWAISARGFNNVLANKLLVLIDGRNVYTPFYAGVFWDVQNILLEDVERVEVISGPGGTMWGANAVNGVINIITKKAGDTQGLYVEAAAGTAMPGLGSIRYGGNIKNNISYRVYGTGFKMGNTILLNDTASNDKWRMAQGGFRLDWEASKKDLLSFQSNIYGGKPNPDGADKPVKASGDNFVARWNHKVSDRADYQLQAYYDHTWRDFNNDFTESLKIFDVDWQNRFQLAARHVLTYGIDLRLMDHKVTNLPLFAFLPEHKTLYLYSGFVQDEITLLEERLRLTLGIKIEHNSYTRFEYQPNARLAWTPAKNQTFWCAVSRAIRAPARIDRDFYLYLAPNLPLISGSDGFISEKVVSYELGWRFQPKKNISISLASFYNVYGNLRSAEPGPPPLNIPITIANGVGGNTYGIEFSSACQLTGWWNLRGGYTYLKKDLTVKPGSKDLNGGTVESDDPTHQVFVQSAIDLPGGIEAGTVLRYTGKLPTPAVPAYTALDIRLGWKLTSVLEIDVTGQNLLQKRHQEFLPSSPSPRQIERSVYGRIICRL